MKNVKGGKQSIKGKIANEKGKETKTAWAEAGRTAWTASWAASLAGPAPILAAAPTPMARRVICQWIRVENQGLGVWMKDLGEFGTIWDVYHIID